MLADSNVWLALALSKHEFHDAAVQWLQSIRTPGVALFCRATQQSFLRLLTTEAVLSLYGIPALSNKAAWSVYSGFQANERISWAGEEKGLELQWKKWAAGSKASPKLWMDAYLAAFAMTGHHQLVTTDKAFKQFKGLDTFVLTKI